ncbi:MAG: DUF1964 domain-containing protein [Firmicutes bacterium]|nr:DUF1964 domain-containing protein [Bacillota bacterium]
MRFRNAYPAFQGDFTYDPVGEESLALTWQKDEYKTTLTANLKTHEYRIVYFDPQKGRDCLFSDQDPFTLRK